MSSIGRAEHGMKKTYWINARDKPAFLVAMMRVLQGHTSQIGFEGDFSSCDFSKIKKIDPFGELGKIDDGTEYSALLLTEETINPILKQILPEGRVVHKIRHIQIQVDGELQLLIGDNFDNECISAGPAVSYELLSELKKRGIIRSIESDESVKEKWGRRP